MPLFTADGAVDHWLTGGTIPGVLATANFGGRPEESFATLRRHRPQDAPFRMEFWNGWFDHWRASHHRRDPADAADVLDRMLSAGASVDFLHGPRRHQLSAAGPAPTPTRDTRAPLPPTTATHRWTRPGGRPRRSGPS